MHVQRFTLVVTLVLFGLAVGLLLCLPTTTVLIAAPHWHVYLPLIVRGH